MTNMEVVNMPTFSFQLAGTKQGFQGTGIHLKAGQTANISAGGTITFGPFGSWPFSPDGEVAKAAGGNAPAPGLTANSLVARAGGEPQYIGSSNPITAICDCVLEFAANDDLAMDNGGYWTVSIQY